MSGLPLTMAAEIARALGGRREGRQWRCRCPIHGGRSLLVRDGDAGWCSMIAGALAWLDRGFAVFPIKPRGKVPLGSLVPRGFLDASRDPGAIRDWWQRSPRANIGIVAGGGYFVLDLDDAEAVSWFTNACGRHGGAPKTMTVRTSRGFHVFFACGAEVPNSAGRLAPGVDVRGKGGYVVAAPSVHPSGHVYTIARDLPVAAAPRRLVDEAIPEIRSVPTPGPMPAWRGEDAKLRAIPGILSLVATARQGERNWITFWAACRFHEMVRDGLITDNLAKELLLQGASERDGNSKHGAQRLQTEGAVMDDRTPGKNPAATLDDILEVAKKRKAKSSNALSDDDLALAFVERHGPDLRYAAAWSKWLKWASMRWEQEKTLAAFDLARKIVRETTGHEGTTQ